VYHRYGNSSDVIEIRNDIVVPVPLESDHVRVKVKASSINPVDWKVMEGQVKYLIPRYFPKIPGRDLSGVVESTSAACTRLKVGDEVYGMPENLTGCWAEYVCCSEKSLSKKPRNIEHNQAAAIPLACLTAWQCLVEVGKLERNFKVLILGAAGGVGHFAVEICKAKGAVVFATCGTESMEFVKSIGADHVIDYRRQLLPRGEKFDLVFDAVGAKRERDESFEMLSKGARVVTIWPFDVRAASHSVWDWPLALADIVWKNLYFGYQNWNSYRVCVTGQKAGHQLDKIRDLVEKGKIKPHMDAEFRLHSVRDALERSKSLKTRGKIGLQIADEGLAPVAR